MENAIYYRKKIFQPQLIPKKSFFESSRNLMKRNLVKSQKILLFLACFVFLKTIAFINCDVFKLGYLTGSARRPGDLQYERPG